MKNTFKHDNPLMFRSYLSGEARLPSSGSEYKLMKTFEFIKAVSDTVIDLKNAGHHEKPLMFNRITFQEKLVSHNRAAH